MHPTPSILYSHNGTHVIFHANGSNDNNKKDNDSERGSFGERDGLPKYHTHHNEQFYTQHENLVLDDREYKKSHRQENPYAFQSHRYLPQGIL